MIGENEKYSDIVPELMNYTTSKHICYGCENQCLINKIKFADERIYFTGNKCEKIYNNKGTTASKGLNHYTFKLSLLESFIKKTNDFSLTLGIPRVLNMYENFPFWSELLMGCGVNVILSSPSTFKQYEKGVASVMSDNICFPAKLVHGHIKELLEQKIDRLFYPYVIYEKKEAKEVANSFNCPIVSGYSDVIKSAMLKEGKDVPLDAPTINFNDEKLLKQACWEYIQSIVKVDKKRFNKAFEDACNIFLEYKKKLKQNCQDILENAKKKNRIVILVAGRPYHTDMLVQHKLTDMITDFDVDVISDDIVREDDYSGFEELNTVSQWTYTNRIMRAAMFVAQKDEKNTLETKNSFNSNIHFVQITSFGCGPDAFVIDEVSEILKSNGKNLTLLKVDDVNNIGSLKLRIRSLLESLKFAHSCGEFHKYDLKQTPIYRSSDNKKTILAPFFSEFYSPFIQTCFEMMGYNFYTMPPSDEVSIQYGLQFANNEICYPATLVIGDIIRELKAGKWNTGEIVIGMTQTGGQCRATNYIMLIKKALIAAGYDNIPVVSIAFSDGLNNQQEFVLDWKPLLNIAIYSVLYADSISKMYYSAVAHEKEDCRGKAVILRDNYITSAQEFVHNKDIKGLLNLLSLANNDFSAIIDTSLNPPKIGIVGEIYVKYNGIGHRGIVSWLVEQGIEVVIPPILSFFEQYFVNHNTDINNNLKKSNIIDNTIIAYLHKKVKHAIKVVNKMMKDYPLWLPFGNINKEAQAASNILSLSAQFGEGWLIPAEINNFNKHNIYNVISLQPFGCIANHIISKGIEKKIKEEYPNMNMLFLDFDSGVSDVNIHNRLHFMIDNARHN